MIEALIICAFLGWLPELLLHEGSHAVCYRMAGARPVTFIAFPHWLSGRFRFGYAEADRVISDRWLRRSAFAPLVKASALLCLWLCLGFFVGFWAFGLALWEAFDAGNWIQGWIRRRPNDGGRARELSATAGDLRGP